MTEQSSVPQAGSRFPESLGRLVHLLRTAPEDQTAWKMALAESAGAVSRAGAHVEAGIENNWAMDDDPLRARLIARAIDAIDVGVAPRRKKSWTSPAPSPTTPPPSPARPASGSV